MSYCAPALLSPQVGRCLLSKAALKTKFKQAFPQLCLRTHLKPTTTSLCATHKTWLSYSEISNYCNEILSERVKQYFLQFTHLDFLVNKLKGRWSAPTSNGAQARTAVSRRAALRGVNHRCPVVLRLRASTRHPNVKPALTRDRSAFHNVRSLFALYLAGFFPKPNQRK